MQIQELYLQEFALQVAAFAVDVAVSVVVVIVIVILFTVHQRFTKGRCQDCDHSVMLHYCHFNKHILNPIKRCGYIADGRKAMLKLKEQVSQLVS